MTWLQSVPFGPKPAPGANMIVDPVGGCHLKKNIDCLTVEGKLMLIGLPGGTKAELDLATVRPLPLSCCSWHNEPGLGQSLTPIIKARQQMLWEAAHCCSLLAVIITGARVNASVGVVRAGSRIVCSRCLCCAVLVRLTPLVHILLQVLQKRLQIIGSTLRARPKAQKAEIVQSFWEFAEPHVAAGRIRPLLDRTYPLKEVQFCRIS